MITLKDIAQMADVSPSAVSRYLNGGSLSEEKSQRIRDAIAQTGYRPNQAAQTLRTGTLKQVGVIVPKINSNSVSNVVAGINSVMAANGYSLLLGTTAGQDEKELHFLNLMQDNQVSGIIVMGTTMTPIKKDALKSCRVPLVITGQNFGEICCVHHDDYGAMQALAEAMIARGRRKIVYVGVDEKDAATGLSRRKAAFDALRQADLDAVYLLAQDYEVESGYQCAQQILALYPDTDGILCATDKLAHGVMKALKEAGKHLPEDVSICGVGDDWPDQLTTPTLTTARLYHEQCGEDAASILLQMIEGKAEGQPLRQIKLGYTILRRESL